MRLTRVREIQIIMQIFRTALFCLLIGAAPAEVPVGKFQVWTAFKKTPLDFIADGVSVHVEALPCPALPAGDSTCAVERYNNQAAVTVIAPGVPPFSVTTDRQSEYARIAIVRFQRGDRRPGVIVESQYGGSGGDMTAQLIVASTSGYQALVMDRHQGFHLQGKLADKPRDISGDGNIDLQLKDGAFDSVFGCNACTPRPPRLFAVKNGKLVDESRDPALRTVFAADMERLAPRCLSKDVDRNGACAAYVADAARAGEFRSAWSVMLKHYEHHSGPWQPCSVPVSAWTNGRCPKGHLKSFPDALHAFLTAAGYLPA